MNRIPLRAVLDAEKAERVHQVARMSGHVVIWRVYASDEAGFNYCAIPSLLTDGDLQMEVQLLAQTLEDLRAQIPDGVHPVDAGDPAIDGCIEGWVYGEDLPPMAEAEV